MVDQARLVLHDTGTADRIAATWELFLDPATLAVVVGGIAWLRLRPVDVANRRQGSVVLAQPASCSLLVTMAWMPLRLAPLVTLVLHQQLRDAAAFPNVGQMLVSTWVHAACACVLAVVLAAACTASRSPPWWTARPGGFVPASSTPGTLRRTMVSRVCAGCVLSPCFSTVGRPVGQRKAGSRRGCGARIPVGNRRQNRTATKVYGEAGSYNYAAVYEYCSQFYDMSQLLTDKPIDDAALQQCDILIIKTPTSRYAPEEVEAVVRFVQQGGSLLMIGDHTNVFNMNTYLNDIARHFGFHVPQRSVVSHRRSLQANIRAAEDRASDTAVRAVDVLCRVVFDRSGTERRLDGDSQRGLVESTSRLPGIELSSTGRVPTVHAVRGLVPTLVDDARPGPHSGVCRFHVVLELLRVSARQSGVVRRHARMVESRERTRLDPRPAIVERVGLVAGLVAGALGYGGREQRPGAWMLLLAATWAAWAVAAYLVVHCTNGPCRCPRRSSRCSMS